MLGIEAIFRQGAICRLCPDAIFRPDEICSMDDIGVTANDCHLSLNLRPDQAIDRSTSLTILNKSIAVEKSNGYQWPHTNASFGLSGWLEMPRHSFLIFRY